MRSSVWLSVERSLPEYIRREESPVVCVVAGGRGLRDQAGFTLLQRLAELLYAEIVASRGAVEEGLLSEKQMIGMSGKSIYADIYLAFGISGTHFHTVGIKGDPYIVAVNTNPRARFLALAEQSVNDDAKKILRRMIAYLEKNRPDFRQMKKSEWIDMLSRAIL